jgi:hypothetical protein
MLSVISGIVIMGSGGGGLWFFMPNKGEPHAHTTVPVLDSVIPILIVTAFAVGLALIVGGAASLYS